MYMRGEGLGSEHLGVEVKAFLFLAKVYFLRTSGTKKRDIIEEITKGFVSWPQNTYRVITSADQETMWMVWSRTLK